MIRTLQFDRKRFLIATIENNIAVDHVFYTEHYTKSSYLVRFAATQHRFMMKMRQWQSTLNRVGKGGSGRLNSSRGDVGVDVGFTNTTTNNQQQQEKQSQQQQLDQQSIDETIKSVGRWKSTVNNHKDESMLKEGRLMSEIDTDYIQYCYGSDAMKLTVVLDKHPDQGLGLTLSVSSGGDGKKKGLNIGDCLLSINEVSLFNKSRHDAVELVKECEREVKLEVLRFPSITEVLACNNNTTDASVNMSSTTSTSNGQLGTLNMDSSLNTTMPSINQPKVSVTSMAHSATSSSRRSPPAGRKASKDDADSAVSSSPYLGVLQKRQRAVSDFGAIGDNLPALNSDDLLNIGKSRKSRDGAPTDSSSSDGKVGMTGAASCAEANTTCHQSAKCTTSMHSVTKMRMMHTSLKSPNSLNLQTDNCWDWTKKTTLRLAPGHQQQRDQQRARRQQNTLDWTNDLSDIEDNTPSSESTPRDGHRRRRVLTITILKTSANQSLGFQIASATSNTSRVCFFVKQVNAEPAISANLHVDDVILSINGTSIEEGYDHQQVVNLLRSSSSSSTSIVLEVERNEPAEYYSSKTQGPNGLKNKEEEEETVSVMLDKSQSNCIGLSLAKRMGHDGIFIRNIAVSSLAAQEGSLRVGDRIWQIDGENVADESPASIVKKLKDIDGCFEIQVKRLGH
uniref:Uncharacterized protein n=1 Tax=Ditylenchus dipsaci TaxID=166011 RepID=A0A915EKP1_9BILA